MKARNSNRTASRGFTAIELMVTLAVIAILTALAMPSIQDMLNEGRAPEVAKGVQKFIARSKLNRDNGGSWSTASNDELQSVLKGDSRFDIQGTGAAAKVLHKLGSGGEIQFAPGAISGANDAGQITGTNMSKAACPVFATSLANYASVMTINSTTVKAAGGTYNGSNAQTACVDGDTNTIVVKYQ